MMGSTTSRKLDSQLDGITDGNNSQSAKAPKLLPTASIPTLQASASAVRQASGSGRG